jgi:cytoskeletal protein CcmA (bactofilin family)
MFSKPSSNQQQPPQPAPQPAPPATDPRAMARPPSRSSSTIGPDMVLTGDVSGGGDIQIDGTVKGDVRVEHVIVGETGQIEGGVFAEAVEVRGKIAGSITAKQVRLYGACHVDGDITHEQLAMETGAFFQGRSLRLQRPAAPAPAPAPPPTPASAIAPPPKPEPGLAPAPGQPAPAPKPAQVGGQP